MNVRALRLITLAALLGSLSITACSKKGSSGSPATGVAPAATEQPQNQVDQSQAKFEIIEQQGVYYLGKFTLKTPSGEQVFTGLVASDSKGPLFDEANRNLGFANVLTAEGLGIISVITGDGQSSQGNLYIFINESDDTYSLMTNAISIERHAGLDRIRTLIRQIMRKKDLTTSEAFALLIQTHLNQQSLSFEELAELLTSENAPVEDEGSGPDYGNDDSYEDDYEVIGTPEPTTSFEINDNVIIRTNPTGPVPRRTSVQPTTADRTPPWRAGQNQMPHYDEVPGSDVDNSNWDNDYDHNHRPINTDRISLRVRCGHDSFHSRHFQSGSDLTVKGESLRIQEIDMCIPNGERRGVRVQGGIGQIKHAGLFGLGSRRYFGGTELFVEVDFDRGSAYDVSRFIKDVDIVGNITILEERALMKGPAQTGRAEFLKTFYVQGRNSNKVDSVNLACEVTYHTNLQCR